MPSNIEIKARVRDVAALKREAERLATAPTQVVDQEDVFFHTDSGRLKLRIFGDGSGELIQYHRPDTSAAKQSEYQIYPVEKPRELRRLLAAALGETVVVKKRRQVVLVGQTRVHLDEVEGLGFYMELEVVLRPDQDPAAGYDVARDLMKKLNVAESDLVAGAYADLLMEKRGPGR